ncbi:hypothetical protein [Mucilaginibacter gilvus]|uniref:Uncharacterized protein n=1 Tax=Mucilaginibacter gilvus TaxID=2305909 RepID=A0A3S3Z5Q1_9SPHI|nr:hypothetical protein [Mucilaginibacter gilvus]RWY53768.1 hypothetical protein EPL05_06775 [Mucilaginibacter gilvus]
MQNIFIAPAIGNDNEETVTKTGLWSKWNAFADAQADSKTLWFIVSLIAQGVLFLPVPAALIYYFNAPLAVLAVTLGLYFANIISGMGGAGIRVMLLFFLASVFIHFLMIAVFIF